MKQPMTKEMIGIQLLTESNTRITNLVDLALNSTDILPQGTNRDDKHSRNREDYYKIRVLMSIINTRTADIFFETASKQPL